MNELCLEDCQAVGAGTPIALLGLALATISAAGYLRDFADGIFDGFGGI